MGFFSKFKNVFKGDDAAQPTAAETAPQTAQPSPDDQAWQADLTLALRKAEPKLSEWLGVILQGVDQAGDLLWQRLEFLFQALDAPGDEARDFVSRFRAWLGQMGYRKVAEFRSELQYRLALALDLEDEEDERDRLFLKLSESISKTKEQITRRIDQLVAGRDSLDEAFWEELEEILIMGDVGVESALELTQRLRKRVRTENAGPEDFKALMAEVLAEVFKAPPRIQALNPPEVVMMVGVNGTGKTTTIAKLAHRAQMQGRKVLIAAGDTFRAAAIDQLRVWAERIGTDFYSKGENADPAAVAYEAMDKAVGEGHDLLLLDTAGRLHTKANLMEELGKIKRVLDKKHPGAPHRTVLVIDATTGQNALSQTKLFKEAVGLDEIILTKLDGTAKGGVAVSVAMAFGVPITFIGLGEKMEDLRPFSGEDFARALVG